MEDALGPSFTSAVVGNVNGEKAVDVGAVASVRVLTAEGEHACEYDVFWEDIFNSKQVLTDSTDYHGNEAGDEQQEPLIESLGQGSDAGITNTTEDSSAGHGNAEIQDCLFFLPAPLIDS